MERAKDECLPYRTHRTFTVGSFASFQSTSGFVPNLPNPVHIYMCKKILHILQWKFINMRILSSWLRRQIRDIVKIVERKAIAIFNDLSCYRSSIVAIFFDLSQKFSTSIISILFFSNADPFPFTYNFNTKTDMFFWNGHVDTHKLFVGYALDTLTCRIRKRRLMGTQTSSFFIIWTECRI